MTKTIDIKLSDILAGKYNKNFLVTYFYGVLHDVEIVKLPGKIGYVQIDKAGNKTPIAYSEMKNWYDANRNKFTF